MKDKAFFKGEREDAYIRIADETPLQYWSDLLNCEKEDLLKAMCAIGSSYKMVSLYLSLNRKGGSNDTDL